ncbi:MAG: phytoene/squalene synthase family protein [Myxococcota bacterium]
MTPPSVGDLEECARLLREGSKSFHAASKMLPLRLRAPAAAVYGFCRVADDAVDDSVEPARELRGLSTRLDGVYGGCPSDHPVDRALRIVVDRYGLPRVAFDALLEGFAWDVEGRRYDTVADLRAYCVRVAGTVGVMMTALMGERRRAVFARAADLGVAMQLTNIARDIGEDGSRGRIYVPTEWLEEAGLRSSDLLNGPEFRPEIGGLARRLLELARPLYARATPAIRHLPRDCRVAIHAARLIYEDIGRSIVDNGYDSVTQRAFTTAGRKGWLLLRSVPTLALSTRTPTLEPPLPEAEFLVNAASV